MRSALSTYTGHGVVPETCTKAAITVLSRLRVNDSRKPASTAGIARGSVTRRNVVSGFAYRSPDASSSCASRPDEPRAHDV